MISIEMIDIAIPSNELSDNWEWLWGILLGALISSAIWYSLLSRIERENGKKLTI